MDDSQHRQLDEIMDSISEEEKAVRKACFEAILARANPSVSDLTERTGLAAAAVAKAVSRLAELGIVTRDGEGAITGCWGLTSTPSSHRFRMLGGDYHGWCAEDVIGIPAALGANASVTSSCFECGREVSIEIKRGEPIAASPDSVRLWIAEAQIGRSIVGFT